MDRDRRIVAWVEVQGEEQTRLWGAQNASRPQFADYEAATAGRSLCSGSSTGVGRVVEPVKSDPD